MLPREIKRRESTYLSEVDMRYFNKNKKNLLNIVLITFK